MIQQKLNISVFTSFKLSPIFCLAIPANLSASFFLLQTKNTESVSFILQILIRSKIDFWSKNFAIGPFPFIDFPFFSKVM